MQSTLVKVTGKGSNPKTTLYVGGLEDNVNDAILHAAFLPFGDIKDVSIPMDHASGKHRGFGFVEFEDKEDANAAIDNMNNAGGWGGAWGGGGGPRGGGGGGDAWRRRVLARSLAHARPTLTSSLPTHTHTHRAVRPRAAGELCAAHEDQGRRQGYARAPGVPRTLRPCGAPWLDLPPLPPPLFPTCRLGQPGGLGRHG